MQPTTDAIVFIVDDDASVRDALAWLLRSRHVPSESFDSAQAFMRMLKDTGPPSQACCVLLDVRMPGMSGLALFDELLRRGLARRMPVIFLTGHADLATAVDAVKRSAFDYCEKPVSDNAMVDRVVQAIAQSASVLQEQSGRTAIERRMGELTERERAVMQRVMDGLPNKRVASELGISVRTVEVHRARVFEKMQVKSAVELTNLLQRR